MRILLTTFLLLCAPALAAAPTELEISVLSHGAKFIGDKTGGARITVADAASGEVLAEGITRGGTGDTDLIMRGDSGRWGELVTASAASFTASLDIESPARLLVTASGPLQSTAAPVTASTEIWLLPGKHRSGKQRLVMELRGYLVELTELDIDASGQGQVTVDLSMLCGCPVMPGGLWDADRIERRARLRAVDGSMEEVPLEYTGKGTLYRADFSGKVASPDRVELFITGMDDQNSSFVSESLENAAAY